MCVCERKSVCVLHQYVDVGVCVHICTHLCMCECVRLCVCAGVCVTCAGVCMGVRVYELYVCETVHERFCV